VAGEVWSKAFSFSAVCIPTLTVSEDRIKSMIDAGKKVDERRKGSRMFLFVQDKTFMVEDPGHLLKKVWRNGRDDELVSLFD
jgi:hypothetical protein